MKISAFLLVIIIGICTHWYCNVVPILKKISEEEVRAMAATAVNRATLQLMGDVSYNDILEIVKNESGDIVLIQAKPVELNMLARNITLVTQSYLSHMGYQGIGVPIGTLSGLAVFSGRGIELHLRVLPVGSADTRFTSNFKTMGINQTHHQIFMHVTADINVVIPGMNYSIATDTQVPIAENVIVGKVPDTYLQSSSLDEMLNLIP